MNSYSFTKIKAWNSCPLSYRLTYIDKSGRNENDPLMLGSALHDFYEVYVNSLIGKNEFNWKEIALTSWAKEPREQYLFDDYIVACEDFTKNFDIKDIAIGSETICEFKIALKEDFSSCEWNDPDCRFRAIIDRIDILGSKAVIVDWKTGFSGKADPFQIYCYAFVISKLYPEIENFEVILYYTRSGWKEKYQFNKDKISGIEFQLQAVMSAIDNDKKFKAKPGSRCGSCLVAHSCDKKPSKIKVLLKDKDAHKIAEDVLSMEAQLDAKKDLLKAWVGENGEVKVNGETFSFFPYETWKGDTKELVSVLTDNNIEPWGYLKTDTKEIKKLCKTDDTLANSLAQALTISSTLRFTHKKDE